MTKHKSGGRPRKFESVGEMQAQIDNYYRDCDTREVPVTMAGLALALGMSRQGLLNYADRDEGYLDAIKKARNHVEAAVEEALMSGKAPAGCIFNLKNNFGWVDKTEQDVTSGGQPVKNEWHVHPVQTLGKDAEG